MTSCVAFGQEIKAPLAKALILIDGKLDEPEWATAGVIENLTQASPRPGEATPYTTVVRILISSNSLIFAIRCDDPETGAIQASALNRDGDMSGDDSITIVLDPFRDGRTGYQFRVNPAGTLQDSLISGGGGEDVSKSWDGQWEAKALRDEQGWTVEIRIPLSTLRYKQGADFWGFNVERFVARNRTRLRWTGASLNYNVNEMSQAGLLSGLKAVAQPPRLLLTPYVLGKYDQDLSTHRNTPLGRVGLDVTYNITSELSAVATLNPDFAEAEVDQRQINLDRFPLFFPEKRRFFLEGENQFQFAFGLEGDFVPFHSRQIGLFNGEVVPIDVGFKAVGRVDRWGVGALSTRLQGSSGSDQTTLSVGRFTYDVDSKLRVGTLLTDGSPDGQTANRLTGFDAVWRTTDFLKDQNLKLGAWYVRSDGDLQPGRRDGKGLILDFPNDLWEITLRHEEFGEALDPALGFLPRPGQKLNSVYTAYQPRPKHGPFRQFFIETSFREWKELGGRTISRRLFTAPFNAVTPAGDHFEFNIAPQFEFVKDAFEIANGVMVPAGSYDFTRYRIQAESSESRPVFLGETVWFGHYFGGKLLQWEQSIGWAPKGSRMKLSLDTEIDWGQLPGGSFRNDLVLTRIDYALDPRRTLSALAQYDSESRDLGANIRYRWQIRPGADLFVVWNRGWIRESGGGLSAFSPRANQFAVKLSWTFGG